MKLTTADHRKGRSLRRRLTFPAVATVLLLVGCAPVVCPAAAVALPYVSIDGHGWLATHPGGSIEACYAGQCARGGASGSFEISLMGRRPDTSAHTLTVTLTTPGSTAIRTARFGLEHTSGQNGSPCRMPDRWSRKVLVRADGELQVGGPDEGHLIIPTLPPTPSSAVGR